MIPVLLFVGFVAQDCGAMKPQFQSTGMKKRAVYRADIGQALKQADIRGEIVLDVLVATDGTVSCTRAKVGHPLLQREVEMAVRLWKFKPVVMNANPVPYAGRLRFVLCNISCGEQGPQMSLLQD